MSLNEVNRQLEELLNQIKRMKKEEQLDSALTRVEELRQTAQAPDNEIAKRNKSQDVRTYELFTKAYKQIKMKGDALRDAGKASRAITDAESIEQKAMSGIQTFEGNIERKKLAVLKEFKERYSEEELIRIKEEEKDDYQSKIEQNNREMAEGSAFLKQMGKFDVAEYDKNAKIVIAINQLEKANTDIQDAIAEISRLESITPRDQDAIDAQNRIITEATLEAKKAKSILGEQGILDAENIFNEDGSINSEEIRNISVIYKKEAENQRDASAEQIKQNLQIFIENAQDPLTAIRQIKKYIPTLRDMPDDFTTLNKNQVKQIVEGLVATGKKLDLKSTHNHQYMQKIDKIEKFLQKLYKEKGIDGKQASKEGNGKSSSKLVQSGREYRKAGVQLDDEYRMKGFWDRRKDRYEYILQTMNPETPLKKFRAWIRSFSITSGYGYALSEAKRVKETQFTRKEEAFKEAYKLVKDSHYSPEQARVVATKNINPDKLSGDKKAQMEERSI